MRIKAISREDSNDESSAATEAPIDSEIASSAVVYSAIDEMPTAFRRFSSRARGAPAKFAKCQSKSGSRCRNTHESIAEIVGK